MRAFASGIIAATFASLRFSDGQILRILEANDDPVRAPPPPIEEETPWQSADAGVPACGCLWLGRMGESSD